MPLRKPSGKRQATGTFSATLNGQVVQIRGLAFKPSFVILSNGGFGSINIIDDTGIIEPTKSKIWFTNGSTMYSDNRGVYGQIYNNGFDAYAYPGSYKYIAYE